MLYLTKIRNAESEFTGNEQKIADFLRANVSELKSVSSRKMAKLLGISQSSIVKFAQKLGAQGFTELRMALIGEYSASREKTNATALHLHSSITSDDSLEVIARKLNREKELALEQTCALFDYARLQKIIEVISKAPFIQITGLGGSALVGRDLSFKLMKIGYRVACEADTHVQATVSQALKKGDVQIAISYSGSKKEIVLCAEAARKAGGNGDCHYLINRFPAAAAGALHSRYRFWRNRMAQLVDVHPHGAKFCYRFTVCWPCATQ